GYNVFVTKYSPAGAASWVRGFGGASTSTATGLAVDGSGNAFVTGSFFGTTAIGGTTLTSAGSYDVYLAKLDPSGNVACAVGFGGAGNDVGTAIAIDGTGAATVAGQFANAAAFGGTTLTSAGGTDVFIARLDGSGNVAWAKGYGGTANDQATGLAVDRTGK